MDETLHVISLPSATVGAWKQPASLSLQVPWKILTNQNLWKTNLNKGLICLRLVIQRFKISPSRLPQRYLHYNRNPWFGKLKQYTSHVLTLNRRVTEGTVTLHRGMHSVTHSVFIKGLPWVRHCSRGVKIQWKYRLKSPSWKRALTTLLVGMWIGAATMDNSRVVP